MILYTIFLNYKLNIKIKLIKQNTPNNIIKLFIYKFS